MKIFSEKLEDRSLKGTEVRLNAEELTNLIKWVILSTHQLEVNKWTLDGYVRDIMEEIEEKIEDTPDLFSYNLNFDGQNVIFYK